MVVETLKLGIAILNGGNAGVQQVMHRQEVLGSFHLTVLTEEVSFVPRGPPTVI